MLGTIGVTRNVRDGAAVDGGCTVDATKGLRRLRIYRYLPRVREALADRANRQAKVAAVAVKRLLTQRRRALEFQRRSEHCQAASQLGDRCYPMVAAAALRQFARGGKPA
jgi:hypothetical protein